MIYRRLDINGDYTFGQGGYNFVKDSEAVSQAIQTRILLLYEEWWENLEEGTPLFQNILNQRNTQAGKNAVDIIIKDRILTTQGVIQITDFESSFDTNKTYTANLSVDTVYGEVNNLSIQLGV